MKKLVIVTTLLLGLGVMISCVGHGQSKTENNETTNLITQEAPPVEEVEPVDTRPRVYACAYDGFVNIRETPKYNAPILGVFRNGPEGALFLGTEKEWTKIDCNGIVGYVVSQYVQEKPTIAYVGTATIDDIAGVYFLGEGYGMYLWDDGTWISGYDNPVFGGKYILQNNEVKLIPSGKEDVDTFEWVEYDDSTAEAHSEILPIDLVHHKLGDWERESFITKQEIAKVRKDFEMGDYGDDWQDYQNMVLYYYSVFHRMTIEDFKNKKY